MEAVGLAARGLADDSGRHRILINDSMLQTAGALPMQKGYLYAEPADVIDASRSIVIFTSNLAVGVLPARPASDGQLREHLRQHGLAPELVGRLSDVLHFAALGEPARRQAAIRVVAGVLDEFGLTPAQVSPGAVRQVLAEADGQAGARGIRWAWERALRDPLPSYLDGPDTATTIELRVNGEGVVLHPARHQ